MNTNTPIATFSFAFKNPSQQKGMANFIDKKNVGLGALSYICAEAYPASGNMVFIASDGITMGVITNDDKDLGHTPSESPYRALFSDKAWRGICKAASEAKIDVTFEVYPPKGNSPYHKFVACINDLRIESQEAGPTKYPNWRSVVPRKVHTYYYLRQDEVKDVHRFLRSLPKSQAGELLIWSCSQDTAVHFEYKNGGVTSAQAQFNFIEKSPTPLKMRFRSSHLARTKPSAFIPSALDEDGSAWHPVQVVSEVADYILIMPLVY